MNVRPSINFTRKAVVDQTYNRNSSNVYKTIIVKVTGNFDLFSMGLRYMPSPSVGIPSPSVKNRDQRFKMKSFMRPEISRTLTVSKLIASSMMSGNPDQEIEKPVLKREMDKLRPEYIKEAKKLKELWENEMCKQFKTECTVKKFVMTKFPSRRPLFADSFCIREWKLWSCCWDHEAST